ncbi:phosphoribosyltransferase [Subsaximicrobium wynnwilliamsii]|jgi:pyrimidine operon attenuation protein/uracil phosphoribosyltransferase|uniref:Phosphoribosyltransferase n=1 Tax=Subsaximicrobium wynnwilliamsii TaxID=291179 RepID=A0A5C6ZE26_9FLAO|nr:phosphoribosyltransferase family protein [Subsaximicrobium wynnwilliamsii]TXD81250.1 phosphoribosyltransferase [Subsaximicrobium wynnwilliamsii]TXD86951.1 phosphoribosyltransferase [Subsaximicrobium wynnwilliamsii]TXE00571.1 phosphoribosyltransferase [Subsaximicrobium wynnwilliamsii]
MKNVILNHQEIQNKIRRIAYQIYESNVDENTLILAGIQENGFILAKQIKKQLDVISEIETTLCKVLINKKNPLEAITTSLPPADYQNKSVVLVDDVLNSGSTLIYGVKHFLDVPLKQFKTAVLVDRNHKKFPIKADYKGLSLSTSLHEHVDVNLQTNNFEAFLK